MIEFDRRQFEEYARAVFTTDSPSGCTADAIALIKSYVEELGYTTHVHNKGTLEVDVPGLDESKTVATSAHVDTLGMMVRSVKSGGTLALTKVGGPLCPTRGQTLQRHDPLARPGGARLPRRRDDDAGCGPSRGAARRGSEKRRGCQGARHR